MVANEWVYVLGFLPKDFARSAWAQGVLPRRRQVARRRTCRAWPLGTRCAPGRWPGRRPQPRVWAWGGCRTCRSSSARAVAGHGWNALRANSTGGLADPIRRVSHCTARAPAGRTGIPHLTRTGSVTLQATGGGGGTASPLATDWRRDHRQPAGKRGSGLAHSSWTSRCTAPAPDAQRDEPQRGNRKVRAMRGRRA